jgi:benzoyl-CoA reductase/2-hydroxyglutaryl-CoA dehydratase subunit BcrC/BadD/HgdB
LLFSELKVYGFEVFILFDSTCDKMALMWFLMSDKQPKMKVLISPFSIYVEYLNIRLSFSFEHTDNISTQLVLMKAYFKLKKAIVF